MYLYNIPEGSKMKLETSCGMEDFTFHHLDGMYSYITRDSDQAPTHLMAMTPMEKVGDHYEIKRED